MTDTDTDTDTDSGTDTDTEYELTHSPLECEVVRDGITVTINIYRGGNDPGWLLEVVDHAGGSTLWEDFFPTEQAALDEAMDAIATDGIGSFAEASARDSK